MLAIKRILTSMAMLVLLSISTTAKAIPDTLCGWLSAPLNGLKPQC